jgi:hypothetical protein
MNQLFIERFVKTEHMKIFYMCSNIPFFENNPQKKFKKFGELLNNIFVTGKMYEDVVNMLSDIQKFIHAIIRFKSIWRYKHAKTYNTDDLYLNPIEPTEKNSFIIIQNNTKYVFRLRELIGIIKTSLSNCCHYFPNPLCCKNPYTNLPFDKSMLYNLYFAIRESNYTMPVLFERYFRINFDKENFILSCEELINEEYLKTYVENNCLDDIFLHVREMFKQHKFRYTIHNNFPKDKLIDIMKPYLNLFFISQFSMNRMKKADAFRVLHRKLHRFIDFNPQFGRRKVRMVTLNPFSSSKKCEYVFDESYLSFYDDVYEDNFMTSHLERPSTPILHTPPSSSSGFNIFYQINNNMSNNYSEDDSDDSDDEQVIQEDNNNLHESEDEENEDEESEIQVDGDDDDRYIQNETQTVYAIEFLNTSDDEDEN